MDGESGAHHVVPINDEIDHDLDDQGICICGPEVDYIFCDDDTVGWIVVHQSLDGREAEEEV